MTQINELLTQMEAFEGVLIASTNLMDNLDAAAMRGFDLKLEFKPLAPDKALQLSLKSLPASMLLKDVVEFKSKIETIKNNPKQILSKFVKNNLDGIFIRKLCRIILF